ncbi:tyrosine-type recombinase/integrase [Calycomorphotria hydatis]|uniref:tyrosine-type recombinase/integrase n=1 Tax=Calycomorphotria hydatis TaxID=2528027 RepID=UPI0011A4C478
MASITNYKDGKRTVQFVGQDGKRRSIRLGKTTMRNAKLVKERVEHLDQANRLGITPDSHVIEWLNQIESDLYEKLARVGLVQAREASLLGPFVDEYLASRAEAKEATRTFWGHTRRNLVDFFGASKQLRDITTLNASDWYAWLKQDQGLAKNTRRRRSGVAKQIFKEAVEAKLIDENPFRNLKSATGGNESRLYFVTKEETDAVMVACPTAEWRLIVAMARYGGVRVPSEVIPLRWSDVNWEKNTIRITSPKTEHHEGRGARVIPIFKELRPYLEDVWREGVSSDPRDPIVQSYRCPQVNLNALLRKHMVRAGIKLWPRLFHNMRATRQTEVNREFNSFLACKWIGNTETVAREHYLQVTEYDILKAAGVNNEVTVDAKVVQNAVQHPTVLERKERNEVGPSSRKARKNHPNAPNCTPLHLNQVGGIGLEPTTSCV